MKERLFEEKKTYPKFTVLIDSNVARFQVSVDNAGRVDVLEPP